MAKKTLWTLNIGGYAPEITRLTYPLFERYAKKIGADFRVITERVFPEMPIVYEKFQVWELGKANDWNIFIDSDAVLHPDCPDVTEVLSKDTVMCFATDYAPSRWKYDNYFRRDGRAIGWGNWFSVSSDWTRDLWRPLDDLTLAEAVENINVMVCEGNMDKSHLIDDYVVSRNVARFGLKFKSFQTLLKESGRPNDTFFWHNHLIPLEQKKQDIRKQMQIWKLVK